MEAAKKTESLSPEIEEKIRQYEALQAELMHKQMDAMRARFSQRLGAPEIATAMPSFRWINGGWHATCIIEQVAHSALHRIF